ncbi:MAG: VTT domain-containing protein [Bacteroidales bacterium]|nr:VTT domain-containing protein [Bacteroidales bacterium]
MTKKTLLRILYLLLVVAGALVFYLFDLQHYFQLSYVDWFLQKVHGNLTLSAFLLSLILVAFSVLNLPTFYFSILFGFLFGFIPGLIISLISRTLGVILAYYNIHFLFFELFTRKYGEQPQILKINRLVEQKGFSAIVILRSLYIFPTSFLNAAFSISKIKPSAYFWGSAIGLLPTSIINVSMGYFIKQDQNLADQPILLGASIGLAICLIIISLLYMRKLK